jgi:hypothetical protein
MLKSESIAFQKRTSKELPEKNKQVHNKDENEKERKTKIIPNS